LSEQGTANPERDEEMRIMPSMKMKTMGGALMVAAALGVLGVAGEARAQEPTTTMEATERARAALEMARARVAVQAEARSAALEMALMRAEAVLPEARAALEAAGMRAEAAGMSAEAALPGAQAAMVGAQADMARAMSWGTAYRGPFVRSAHFRTRAPAPWLQEDSAAQAYKAARDALNAGRFADAAKSFEGLRSRYPRSGYVADSYYWQAFALYRAGGRTELKKALGLLAQQENRYPKADTRGDAEGLRVRVESQLARLGDAAAAEAVTQQAKDPCQGEDQSVRTAALSALMNMNADQALPILKEVLKSRDACSAQLRRQAVFLVAQKMSDQSVDILLDLAQRNPDPDPKVREAAVFWLSQVHTDQAVDALASILKESKDPNLQERAVFALSQQGSGRAMKILQEYAERPDAPAKLRETAIFWIGQNPKAGGTTYLMDLYPKLRSDTLKEKVIFSIGQSKLPRSHDWLLARAKDRSESVEVRKNALFWAGQTGSLSGADLKSLYATLTDPDMRKQVVFVAGQSKDKEAVDFLMDVAQNDKDPEIRKTAVFWLGQSKDPRVAQFLLTLIRK
jgi:HEAT repeat protein